MVVTTAAPVRPDGIGGATLSHTIAADADAADSLPATSTALTV